MVKISKFIFLVTSCFLLSLVNLKGQSITNIQPDEGQKGDTLTISITGQNTSFQQGSSTRVRMVKSNGPTFPISPLDIQVMSNTNLKADFSFAGPYDTGYYDLLYQNLNTGTYLRNKEAFYLKPDPTPPKLTKIDPNVGEAGNVLSVNITGKNFEFSQGSSTRVSLRKDGFIQQSFTNVVKLSPNKIVVSMDLDPGLSPGFYDVSYINRTPSNFIQVAKESGFFVKNNGVSLPKITSVKDDTLQKSGTREIDITINSGNFFNNPTDSIYLIKGNSKIPANRVSFYDKRKAEATFNLSSQVSVGYYDVLLKYAGSFDLLSEKAVYVTDNKASSGNNRADKAIVKTFPNPCSDYLNINLKLSKPMKIKGQLMSTSGRHLKTMFHRKMESGQNEIRNLNLKGLSNGIYFLELSASSNNDFHRLIRIQKQ